MVAVLSGFFERAVVLSAHQRSVHYLQLRTGSPLAHLAVIVFGKSGEHPCALQQLASPECNAAIVRDLQSIRRHRDTRHKRRIPPVFQLVMDALANHTIYTIH